MSNFLGITKKKGLVSTLMCTYNAEKFIKGTLESVLEQTYNNQETLIWDDGSTDKTIEIIKKYIEKGYKIKIWTSKDEGKKLGPYGGLNFLIDKSKGEFIAIQDHDDIWHPEKLEKQVSFMNNNLDYIGCGTGMSRYFELTNSFSVPNDIENKGCEKGGIYHPSLLFRNNGFMYDLSLDFKSDWFFTYFILGKKGKLLKLGEILMIRRDLKNCNNLSRKWFRLGKRYYERYILIHGKNFFYFYIMVPLFNFIPCFIKNYLKSILLKRSTIKRSEIINKNILEMIQKLGNTI